MNKGLGVFNKYEALGIVNKSLTDVLTLDPINVLDCINDSKTILRRNIYLIKNSKCMYKPVFPLELAIYDTCQFSQETLEFKNIDYHQSVREGIMHQFLYLIDNYNQGLIIEKGRLTKNKKNNKEIARLENKIIKNEKVYSLYLIALEWLKSLRLSSFLSNSENKLIVCKYCFERFYSHKNKYFTPTSLLCNKSCKDKYHSRFIDKLSVSKKDLIQYVSESVSNLKSAIEGLRKIKNGNVFYRKDGDKCFKDEKNSLLKAQNSVNKIAKTFYDRMMNNIDLILKEDFISYSNYGMVEEYNENLSTKEKSLNKMLGECKDGKVDIDKVVKAFYNKKLPKSKIYKMLKMPGSIF